jgi:hypothetical protein
MSLPRRVLRRVPGTLVILLAAALATLPQRVEGYSCGHDFNFHLLSWIEVWQSWLHGLFYPHWAASPDYGAGEPRFVFYPPLTWLLGAALLRFSGWVSATLLIVFLPLAGTGLATRALALQLLDDGAATLAGCISIFSGYTLFTAYERSAFGELTGGFWIPLLLLFALRDRNSNAKPLARALDGSALWLALVLAGAWLSNVPLGIMACYLLAAVAVVAALLRKSWSPVLRAAVSTVTGLCLASFYLVPATWEQKWVDVKDAISDPGSRIENSWMFARHSDPALDLHDTVLLKVSIIAASMLAVAFAGLVVARLRGRLSARREWWLVLAIIPVAILLLQFPVSLPLWNLLPKLRMLQFPWRWLVALEAPMAILLAAALWPLRLGLRIAVGFIFSVLFLVAADFAGLSFHQKCDPEDTIASVWQVYHSGAGFEGDEEYGPPGTDDSLIPTGLPGACLVADPEIALATPDPDTNPVWDPRGHICKATYSASWLSPEHLRVTGSITQPGYLVLRLRSYPAWRVTVNGHPAPLADQRDDGLMVVAVPSGAVEVDVRWAVGADTVAGLWLSAAALVLLALLWFLEYKLRTPHAHLS